MRKNTKVILSILCIVLLVACACAVLNLSKGNNEPETTLPVTSQEQTSETTTAQQPTVEESTTEATTKKAKQELKGYYYIFDDESIGCYVLKFADNGEVKISYFSEDNIYGGDPQYTKGYGTYEIGKNEIKISNLPASLPASALTIEIKDDKLLVNDIEVQIDDELSIDKVNAHFV